MNCTECWKYNKRCANCGQHFFIARVKARNGLLLGGVKYTESSAMPWTSAVNWSNASIENNKAAGRFPIFAGIRMA